MSWVWEHSRSQPTQRLVLLAIADCANDVGDQAYPAISTLARKTGLSERGVRSAVTGLVAIGELQVAYKAGPRGCNRYRVVMEDPAGGARNLAVGATSTETRQEVHVAQDAGSTRQEVPGTWHETTVDPAPPAPEPSENHPPTEPSVEPSVARKRATTTRGTRLPEDFAVTPEMIEWAKTTTPLVGAKETAAFADYWHSAPGSKGVKADWKATWRNWMRRAQAEAESRPTRASPGKREHNGLVLNDRTIDNLNGRRRMEALDAASQPNAIEGAP